MRSIFVVIGTSLLLSCTPAETIDGASAIFPNRADPTPFSRAYSMTESLDGTIRVFAREKGDATLMFEMRKGADGTWSEPAELEFPKITKLTEPSFSFSDGYLYYSSDAPHPERGRGKDLNIWRVEPTPSGWGTPEALSQSINTGASELSPAMDKTGRLYFTSNHTRGVGGHDIYYANWNETTQDWDVFNMPQGFNEFRADAHLAVTPGGDRLFFYSHRGPKMGSVDIWTAVKDADGLWQQPVNLGLPVNTSGIDFGPGLSGDGQTLFFSREGRLMQIPLSEALAGEGWTPEASSDGAS